MEKSTEWLRRRLQAQQRRITSVMAHLGQDEAVPLEAAVKKLDVRELRRLADALRELQQTTGDIDKVVSKACQRNALSVVPASGSRRKSQTQMRSVDVDEMALSVSQLVEIFEASADYDSQTKPDWVSMSGLTKVVRNGHSAFATRSLAQQPDAVFAEYVVLHRDVVVFTYKDYVWPDLAQSEPVTQACLIPALCFQELLNFHRCHDTRWYGEYRELHSEDAEHAQNGKPAVPLLALLAAKPTA